MTTPSAVGGDRLRVERVTLGDELDCLEEVGAAGGRRVGEDPSSPTLLSREGECLAPDDELAKLLLLPAIVFRRDIRGGEGPRPGGVGGRARAGKGEEVLVS